MGERTALFLKSLAHLGATAHSFLIHGAASLIRKYSHPEADRLGPTDHFIVCVHGRGGNYTNFVPLKEYIEKRIGHNIWAVDLGNTATTTIKQDSEKLSELLGRLSAGAKITLVGLSKGGLVVSHYALSTKDPRLERVITVSSPLCGTDVAGFSSCRVTRSELGPGGETIRDLIQMARTGGVPFYHVVPTWDHLISPTSSARFPSTPESNVYHYRGRFNHVGILHSKEVADKIVEWVAGDDVSA